MNPHERFFEMLPAFLKKFWDTEKREFKKNESPGFLSSGEKIMYDFFVSVWLGRSSGFDLISAVGTLDDQNFAIIRKWVNDPFFP